MDNSVGAVSAKLNDRSSQIRCIRRAPALVVYNIQRRAASGQLQNRIWKAFPSSSEQPRGADDADVGNISSNWTSASAFDRP